MLFKRSAIEKNKNPRFPIDTIFEKNFRENLNRLITCHSEFKELRSPLEHHSKIDSTKTWSSRAKGEIIPRVATAPTSTGPKIVDRVSGAVTAASGQWMRHLGVRKPSLSPRRLIATVPTVKLASPEPELPTAAPPIKRKKRPRPPPPMANIPRMPILI